MHDHEKREDPKVAELKDAIQAGIESGAGVPAHEVFDRLEKKCATTEKSSVRGGVKFV